jgi:adenylate cyclase
MQHDTPHPADRTQQREVTLLFADLRGFTGLASALEVQPVVYELLGHVMDCLTEAVQTHHGTVVDYYGDGLVAMWNAPHDQRQHADLASSAALEMIERLPGVSADWHAILQAELQLGVGIHTGMAHVGNAGSTQQSKYGPRGANVNLTSRVEAATKELRLPILATAATVDRLSNRFLANRVCRARMPGVPEPIDLYSLCRAASSVRCTAEWRRYDEALRCFEAGRFQDAADLADDCEHSCQEVPWRFLVDEIRREIGKQQQRRSTDKPVAQSGGIVVLNAK